VATTERRAGAWLGRLMAAFPSPGWPPERIEVYLEAMEGAEERHVSAVVSRVIRGGWQSDFAPVAPALRMMVDEIAGAEREERNRIAYEREAIREAMDVAPPWFPMLYGACLLVSLDVAPPPDLVPYAEIVRRYGIAPGDTAGDDAIGEAEEVWRASGNRDTAEAAARRVLGGMSGRTLRAVE
jgi:hypothetical protein